MTLFLVVVGLTIFISFLCSVSEAVLYSVPITTVEALVQKGSRTGRLFRKFKQNIERPIAAILGLNTTANTAGAALAGALFVEEFGAHWLWLFTLLITLVILFFSEILPKTLGATFSRPLAAPVALYIQFLLWVMAPLVLLIQKVSRFILPSRKTPIVTPEEIVGMASLIRKEGGIDFMQESIIGNVLHLKDRKAQEIMTPRTVVFSLPDDLTLEAARLQGLDWPHSRVPVYSEDPDRITGIVMRRVVFKMLSEGKKETRLSEIARPVHFVPGMVRADRLLKTFLTRREHLFGVVDEFGGFAGVVSLEDVLEELIGREIIGEFDRAVDMSELARKKGKERKVPKGP